MPFLVVFGRVDVGAQAAQLALPAHDGAQQGPNAFVADELSGQIRFKGQQPLEGDVADTVADFVGAAVVEGV